MRYAADVPLVMTRLRAVVVDGLLEGLEGIDRLLEHLYHGDAAHVFRPRLAHAVLRGLILLHELGILAAHHGEHRCDGDDSGDEASSAHAPVEHEHEHNHGDKHRHGAHNISQIVREQRFGFR